MSRTEQIVMVDVQYALDGAGNCSGSRYRASCDQDGITIGDKGVQVTYRLTDTTPAGVVFSGFKATPSGQLTPPSISADGRSMTTVDTMTSTGVIKVDLQFRDNSVFVFDPEVTNGPQV